jgi:4-hydroxy-3-polyprenylbenzoate decarboxylase
VGFDATRKWPGEGVVRPWPDPIVMSDEVRTLVDRRWTEYGIDRPAHKGTSIPRRRR